MSAAALSAAAKYSTASSQRFGSGLSRRLWTSAAELAGDTQQALMVRRVRPQTRGANLERERRASIAGVE
jgi:hypothetical protein